LNSQGYRLHHACQIAEHLRIREAHNPPSCGLEHNPPAVIFDRPILMRHAIQLDDKPFLPAVEIGDVGPDDKLPREAGAKWRQIPP
jgi:hypothetical protein